MALTIPEAAGLLDPPLPAVRLRAVVVLLGWQPCGWRHTGRRGRPQPTYDIELIMRLHASLVPFIQDP